MNEHDEQCRADAYKQMMHDAQLERDRMMRNADAVIHGLQY